MCFAPNLPGGTPSLNPVKNIKNHGKRLKNVVKNPGSLLTGKGDRHHPVTLLTKGPPKMFERHNPLEELK